MNELHKSIELELYDFLARELLVSRMSIQDREKGLYLEEKELSQRVFDRAKELISIIKNDDES